MEKVKLFLRKNSAVFDWDRIVCRIFAAWTIVIAYGLIKDNKYTELQYNQDISLVNVVLCIEILFIAFSIVNMMLKCYETDTWFLMGGATVCVISWLTAYEAGNTKYMFAFAVALAYSLILIYCINRNRLLWKMWNPSDRTVWIFAIVCGIICGFVIGAITCYRYKVFATPNFDFGIFVNMFYNMKESGLPITTCERDVFLSHFVVHLSPIYYLILPFYMIFSTPLT